MNLRICGALAGLSYTARNTSAHRFSSFSSLSERAESGMRSFSARISAIMPRPFSSSASTSGSPVLPCTFCRLSGVLTVGLTSSPCAMTRMTAPANRLSAVASAKAPTVCGRNKRENSANTTPNAMIPAPSPLRFSDGLGWLIWLAPSMPRGCPEAPRALTECIIP